MITLMYHNLVARRQPDLPEIDYQITVKAFARQVESLASGVLDPLEVNHCFEESRPLPRGFLLTFDDGAAGLMEAIPILRRHRARAVVFVCPGQLEAGLWCHRLAHLLTASRVAELRWRGSSWKLPRDRMSSHQVLIDELQRMPGRLRHEALVELEERLKAGAEPRPIELQVANEATLHEMAESGCFLFANHTWSHANLAHLSETEAAEEMDLAQQWLQTSGLPTVPWFAFPHGGFDDRVVELTWSRGLVPFGASSESTCAGVAPRVGIYRPDEWPWRFQAKLWRAGMNSERSLPTRPARRRLPTEGAALAREGLIT